MRHFAKLNFRKEYRNVFSHESGDPGVLFAQKTEGQKSRETVPLSEVHNQPNRIL
jgi:hypothetical protein